MYDPKTKKLTHISTCFGTHHLMFAEDANNTLWTSGGGQVVGWLNTKMFDETRRRGEVAGLDRAHPRHQRQRQARRVRRAEPAGRSRRRTSAIGGAFYAVAPAPDGSIWGSVLGFPGAVVRLVPGSNPPETALAEVYEPPFNNPKATVQGFSPRGRTSIATASSGRRSPAVTWRASIAASARGRSTARTATGQHCPEGWTLYPEPLPQFKGVTDSGSAEASYYTWVDQFDTLGLGANMPINTGNASEGLLALKDGKWVVLRVPYPIGFYTKWMDGRIDDPKAGWKGRDSGARSARARRSTWKRAKARRAR